MLAVFRLGHSCLARALKIFPSEYDHSEKVKLLSVPGRMVHIHPYYISRITQERLADVNVREKVTFFTNFFHIVKIKLGV